MRFRRFRRSPQVDLDYLHGFVYFRQVRDRSARRGYFQKSLVILSRFPFINLFYEVVAKIAPQFFEHGADVLKRGADAISGGLTKVFHSKFSKQDSPNQISLFRPSAACRDIDHWPAPLPGTLSLSILNASIQTTINHRNEKPNGSPTSNPTLAAITESFQTGSLLLTAAQENICPAQATSVLIPSIYTLNVYKSFLPVISHAQLLWELVITCEPLIVMAPTPDACSEVVQSLVSIISPLKYSRDYRPFFTIHDSEFKEYTSKKQAPYVLRF